MLTRTRKSTMPSAVLAPSALNSGSSVMPGSLFRSACSAAVW